VSGVLGLDPATYEVHAVHGEDRTFTETNCYVDCLVEVVHAAGLDPVAMLGGAVRSDVEGDQWTLFKPTPGELETLYGIDLHEVQPYRGLLDLVVGRLAAGRLVMPEVDSFHLPDLVATSYRTDHVKTTIVAEHVDPDAKVLHYFHNAGYYELAGDDFDGLFAPGVLPLYVEAIRFDAAPVPAGEELRERARDLLRTHLARRPADNPFTRFADLLVADLPALLEGSSADFHAYAFHNPRLVGASMELLATHVRWLFGEAGEECAAALDDVVGGAKMLLFRLARQRAFDVAGVVTPMAESYDAAMKRLDDLAS
jgi:hypothetical protein